jgi:RimJ/RimL family protein N-acetyltransferase
MTPLTPVTLRGQHVRLLPLDPSHTGGLAAAARDSSLDHLWFTTIPSPNEMSAEIERRLALHQAGAMLPFTVLDANDTIVGMTTYMNIDRATPRVEIGSTWYAARVQRTALNTEAKLLLLGYAFDALGCPAVEFRTHFFNAASRTAIERLGAKLDGVLRNHVYTSNGTLRDTCVYSILTSEWPTVRAHLQWQLTRPR